jgi:predicted  nucleic acid-binding Zn-ribbon protein
VAGAEPDVLRDLERRLDQAYAHIELLSSRMVEVEQRLPQLLFEAGMAEGLKLRCAKVEAELARHDERIQEVFEIWRGTQQRIERQTGTLSDLLMRFEAWKTVGNELGEQVDHHEDRLGRHGEMHQTALKALQDVRLVLTEMRDIVAGEQEGEPCQPSTGESTGLAKDPDASRTNDR